MQKFQFLSWKVYKDSQELFVETTIVVNKLPREYRFELGSQIIRSSLSIILNIAEGSAKQSSKEMNRFVEISLGSAYETLACFDTMRKINLLEEEKYKSLQARIDEICSQLGGLKKKLLIRP